MVPPGSPLDRPQVVANPPEFLRKLGVFPRTDRNGRPDHACAGPSRQFPLPLTYNRNGPDIGLLNEQPAKAILNQWNRGEN